MAQRPLKIFFLFVFMGMISPLFASHGSADSDSRDGWINEDLQSLADWGLILAPSKSVQQWTNSEAARFISKAGEILLAQADLGGLPPLPGDQLPGPGLPDSGGGTLPPPGGLAAKLKSVQELVEEYKGEMIVLGVNPT